MMVVRLVAMMVGIVLSALLGEPAAAKPQPRTALVLEKSGTMRPDVKPFSEIKAGMVVTLETGSRLTFLHYPTCTTVVISKGSVRFKEKDYEVIGAKPDSARSATCPRRVSLRDVGEAGAGNLRSLDGKPGIEQGQSPLTFPPKPEFVLVGERSDDYATLRILSGGEAVLEAPLTGPRFEWPKDAPPLKKNTSYEFALMPKALGVGRIKKPFRVQGSHTDDGNPAALFVIDLD